MSDYFKYCICKHPNPETEDSCEQCGNDISGVVSESRRQRIESQVLPLKEPGQTGSEQDPICEEKPEEEQVVPTLTLVSSNGIEYTVLSGDIVGKNRAGSNAQVRLGDESGETVHRHHCRFLFENSGWVVIPLEQPPGWHTNDTFVNDRKIEPNTRGNVENGDVIRLEETEYRIRLLNN
jgi:hypothetical protein